MVALPQREARLVAMKMPTRPTLQRFTPEEVKDLHRHLFGTLYEWAGDFRQYTTGRGQAPFAQPERIEPALQNLMGELRSENHLQGLDRTDFARRAAHYANEFNAVHPFVEGNGRVTRLLVKDLATNAGYAFDLTPIERDQAAWYQAAERGFTTGDPTPFVPLIEQGFQAAAQRREVLLLAGPNGSGKSTLFERRFAQDADFVNADRIAAQLERGVDPTTTRRYAEQLARYRQAHPEERTRFEGRSESLLNSADADEISRAFAQQVQRRPVREAVAAQLASAEREERLEQNRSFASETVFSHPSKLDFLREAEARGFDTRLVFVATENPQLNVQRVALRVEQGGHDVPTDKVIARYSRALDNLDAAISIAGTVEVYDNSVPGRQHERVATFERGRLLELRQNPPRWIQRTLGEHIAEYTLVQGREATALKELGYPKVAASGRFANVKVVSEDAVFPLTDKDGNTVAVQRGETRLGREGAIYQSEMRPEDTRLAITQTPLDALAHAELNKSSLATTRYLAVDSPNTQARTVQRALQDLGPKTSVVIATPNTGAGQTLAAQLTDLAQAKGLSVTRSLPGQQRTWQEKLQVQASWGLGRGLER